MIHDLFFDFLKSAPHYIYNLFIFSAAAVLGFLTGTALFRIVHHLLKDTKGLSKSLMYHKMRLPLQLLFTVVGLNVAHSFSKVTPSEEIYIQKILYITLIISFALLLIKTTELVKALLYIKFDVNVEDNMDERKARTQIDFLQKLFSIMIVLVAAAVVLMSFSRVKELGTSILASAGIAGLLVGLAAQKSIANLLAGFQIAFTQPIRLGDLVVVENETGKIEEITLTYVVVRLWDLRRLIVPISYFLDKPFQNWTRTSEDILGTVFLYADYVMPVDAIRKELARILANEGKVYWDGKTANVQMTNATEKIMEIRILVSAAGADENWDLRCLIREQMITFIRNNYPHALPRQRMETLVLHSGKTLAAEQ